MAGVAHRGHCVWKEGQKRCTQGGEDKTRGTNNLVNAKLRPEGGGGAAPGPGAEISPQPAGEPEVTEVVPLQLIEGTVLSVRGGHHREQVDVF